MADLTPEQFAKKLNAFAKELPAEMNRLAVEAGQQLLGDIPARIFSDSGTKDIKGNKRKYKSKQYLAKRKERNYSNTDVNLVFDGDLLRSVKLFKGQKNVDLKIFGKKQVLKARANEKLFKNNVFEANKKEVDKAQEIIDEGVSDLLNSFFK